MSFYVVNYRYAAESTELDAIRPVHREWLKQLLNSGILLASGPMIDQPTALLIFKADSLEQLAALLDNDPFDIAGFIGEREIVEWNPVFGPWS